MRQNTASAVFFGLLCSDGAVIARRPQTAWSRPRKIAGRGSSIAIGTIQKGVLHTHSRLPQNLRISRNDVKKLL